MYLNQDKMNRENGKPDCVDNNLGVGQGQVDVGTEAGLGVDDGNDVDVTNHAEDESEDMLHYLCLDAKMPNVQRHLLLKC